MNERFSVVRIGTVFILIFQIITWNTLVGSDSCEFETMNDKQLESSCCGGWADVASLPSGEKSDCSTCLSCLAKEIDLLSYSPALGLSYAAIPDLSCENKAVSILPEPKSLVVQKLPSDWQNRLLTNPPRASYSVWLL